MRPQPCKGLRPTVLNLYIWLRKTTSARVVVHVGHGTSTVEVPCTISTISFTPGMAELFEHS